MTWQPTATAPTDGTEITVRDTEGREALAWWDLKSSQWRSGGIHHGFPEVPELAGHGWTEWRQVDVWKIV